MRVPPQVSDRIKEAPAQALRGVFAGVGQLLLITDRLRNKTAAQAPHVRAPQQTETRADPVPPVPPVSSAERVTEASDLDKTANVRLLPSEEAGAGSAAPAVDAAAGAPVADAEPDVPLPNYDELSIASLRARLRNLDAAQVKLLAEYERAHAARADVITMFERRLAKLEAGD